MVLPIPAGEIAVGDYSPDHGHVSQVKKGLYPDKVEITFKNGTVITPNNETEIIVDQGGRF